MEYEKKIYYLKKTFFEECQKIEKEMCDCDPEKDEARLKIPYIKIAELMLKRNEEAGRYYFYSLFKALASKSNVYFDGSGIDLDEIIIQVAEETFTKYKPEKGHLYKFVSDRFKYRAVDKLRSLHKVEYIESYNQDDEDDELGMDNTLFKKMKSSVTLNPVEEDAVGEGTISVLFCDLAAIIIKFISSGTLRQINRQRISQAMYSNDVLTVVSKGFSNFNNERNITSAMSIPYMNHCTIEADAYGENRALNIENMQSGKLKTDKETCWIPQEEPRPVLDGSEPEMKLPAMNEVYRGYLAQVYDVVRSAATITLAKEEYETMKKSLLNIV